MCDVLLPPGVNPAAVKCINIYKIYIVLNKYTCTGHDGDNCEGSFSEELDVQLINFE
jgi:hypothetical protein